MNLALQVALVALVVAVVLARVSRDIRVGVGCLAVFALAFWLDSVEPVADWVRSFHRERWFAFVKGAIIVLGISALLSWGDRRGAGRDDARRTE